VAINIQLLDLGARLASAAPRYMASDADLPVFLQADVPCLEPVKAPITFREAAEKFMQEIAQRKRRPARPSTLRTYKSQLDTYILPILGDQSVADFNVEQMKLFVDHLTKMLSPKSTACVIATVKAINNSIRDSNGHPLFPKNFTAILIDAPSVVSREQNRPAVTKVQIEKAIQAQDGCQLLYAVLASAGLRISEALAMRVNGPDNVSSWDSAGACVIVRTQLLRGVEGPPKTENAFRTVPLPLPVNQFLIDTPALYRGSEFLFPISETELRRRMDKLKLPPPHAFRRFYAAAIEGMPDALQKYLMGHSAGGVHEKYNMSALDPEVRHKWREQTEMGFELGK
jgi:integrase